MSCSIRQHSKRRSHKAVCSQMRWHHMHAPRCSSVTLQHPRVLTTLVGRRKKSPELATLLRCMHVLRVLAEKARLPWTIDQIRVCKFTIRPQSYASIFAGRTSLLDTHAMLPSFLINFLMSAPLRTKQSRLASPKSRSKSSNTTFELLLCSNQGASKIQATPSAASNPETQTTYACY